MVIAVIVVVVVIVACEFAGEEVGPGIVARRAVGVIQYEFPTSEYWFC